MGVAGPTSNAQKIVAAQVSASGFRARLGASLSRGRAITVRGKNCVRQNQPFEMEPAGLFLVQLEKEQP